MSDIEDQFQCTPSEIHDAALNVVQNLLPTKSRIKYEKSYKKFENWCYEHKVQNYTENVFLGYFSELANKFKMKSSTLWSEYSMLKAVVNIKKGDDIGKFSKLRAFLKKQGENYTPKKSRVLTKENFDKFMRDAPDEMYLAVKVNFLYKLKKSVSIFIWVLFYYRFVC